MGCCEGLIKFLLFIFNGALIAAGVALVIVGGVAGEEFRDYSDENLFDDKYLWAPVALAIVVGLILVFVGITGIGGVCCKNTCMLKAYIFFLVILIIFEIVLCVVALVYKDDGEADAKKSIRRVISSVYGSNRTSSTRDALDKLQRKFDCCGGTNLTDYTSQTVRVPESCCIDPSFVTQCRQSQLPVFFHTEGCAKALFDKIGDYAKAFFAVGIVFALLQIVGLILACKYLNEDKD